MILRHAQQAASLAEYTQNKASLVTRIRVVLGNTVLVFDRFSAKLIQYMYMLWNNYIVLTLHCVSKVDPCDINYF